ncbi:enoyl-CoA hydratase/isomerase family protein [Sphingomonas sp. CGMCC 1.13654]|uniref:Enoyl-CoA hydratase/isomerase family protein n=1 Tax=Sphingomonas chungangi TaxID=2683589 RepID=A0A838L417_9SPHN|nr:enoyl-CoA hydratase-related protein [Sphingomonas chungangi]MBA2933787.1 enoyl-CoA hydratase/isomerase family protein [Sphingomonas chungangi]MVW55117.1 enoyl-CoA hydratase/isomerase family protein [Sphingomonas chungangi]
MHYETLLVERRDAIDILTLNRPDSLNALSQKMVIELADYVSGLKQRTDVRVVVLRGAGRAFCAGLDIKEARIPTNETRLQRGWRVQVALGDVLKAMRSLPQPFVALGHGSACGGGFSLMLASDVRIGAPTLRMNAAYIKIGLGGADIGSSYFLPRLVGASLAAELLLTGRFIHAERALSLGLVSDVVEEDALLDAGLSMAAEMVANAPMGLALTKQALNMNIDAPSIDHAFAIEDRQQVMLSESEDHREAMTAFIEKRLPVYTGR